MREILKGLRDQESQFQQAFKGPESPKKMKNINDVLREKELQLQQVQKEIDALKLAMRLLTEESGPVAPENPRLAVPVTVPDAKLKDSVAGMPSPSRFP